MITVADHTSIPVRYAVRRRADGAWLAMGDRLLELGLPEPVHEALSVGSKLPTEPELREPP